jgi:hypothetical protein
MDLGAMIYTSCLIKIGSDIQMLIGGGDIQQADLKPAFIFYK